MRILTWAVGSLLLVVLLTGCFDVKSWAGTVSKWPLIKQPEELVLTPEELATVQRWAVENPSLITKIKQQSDAYRAGIEAYNKAAREHNKKVVEEFGKAMGWSREDILKALNGE